jgi:hypothetical protein
VASAALPGECAVFLRRLDPAADVVIAS